MLFMALMAVLALMAVFFVMSVTVVYAQPTIDIAESPIEILEEDIGELFNVTVRISDVPVDPGAAGVEFKVRWDSSVLEGVSMVLPSGHFMEPDGDDANLWKVSHVISPEYAYYNYTFWDINQGVDLGYLPKSGSGNLAVITFNATAAGETDLTFPVVKVGGIFVPPNPPPSIETTGVDGHVTVIPEFPTFMLPLLFVAATAFAIIFGRKVGQRNRV